MTKRQFGLLLLISALWGSSFIFMRVLVPMFGPFLTPSIRLLTASLFLYLYFLVRKLPMSWRDHWRWYLLIGLLNSAIPFALYSFAALHIEANMSVILNSTSPLFGMVYAALLLKEQVTLRKVAGLLLGTSGVVIISSTTFELNEIIVYASILACVVAASLYGLSGAIIKRYVHNIPSNQVVMGSMLFAGIMLLPFGLFRPIEGGVTALATTMLVVFGIFTAIAYVIYFLLITEVGPMKALTTTYLMPLFGILFSALFLHEQMQIQTILGLAIILTAIYLITTKTKRSVN